MKTIEYNQFNDTHIPYIDNLELSAMQKAQIRWELSVTPLSTLARWVLYRALRQPQKTR